MLKKMLGNKEAETGMNCVKEEMFLGTPFYNPFIFYHFSTSRALWAEQIPPRGAVFPRQSRRHVPLLATVRPETLRPTLSSGLPFSGLEKKLKVSVYLPKAFSKDCAIHSSRLEMPQR